MPQFAPFIQRAGEQTTTITSQPPLAELSKKMKMPAEPASRDVKLRRYQRWFFYGLIVVLFLGALGLIIKVYNDNSNLVANVDNLTLQVKQKNQSLDQIREELAARNQEAEAVGASLEQVRLELAKNVNELNSALSKSKQATDDLAKKTTEAEQEKLTLEKAKANTLNLVLDLGVGMSDKDINKIALADIAVAGMDTDKDGLTDDMEKAVGSDPLKMDTDGDNYNDREETLGGFNPAGNGLLGLDDKFAQKWRGKIVLNQRQGVFYAWYVAQNSQRYYLGNSQDQFEALRLNDYWTRSRE